MNTATLKPRHIAIVMDGNGRWAKQRNLPRIAGHKAGAKAVEAVVKACGEEKIEILTLFAFSSENWGRPPDEIEYLMDLFLKTLQRQIKTLHENNVQLRVIGDCSKFSKKLQESILKSQQLTARNTALKLIIAANYSGRWDITQGVQKIAQQIEQKQLNSSQIDMQLLQNHLCLSDLPEPDLLIRTSGELRISNFMLWQFAYTEFFFTETLWPDFDANELKRALASYTHRQRRFGLTSEQIESEVYA